MTPHTRRGVGATWCPCLPCADWCLQSDVMTNARSSGWDDGKNPDDYHLYFDAWWQRDIYSMVMRDRNSPSIVMWSIGNEIPMRRTPKGTALSGSISTILTGLSWICVGIHRRRALPSPVCA